MNITKGQVSAIILGVMQDAGLPHIGCLCTRCQAAYAGQAPAAYAACLGLVDKRWDETAVWLFDATPDIKWQLNMLAAEIGSQPTGQKRMGTPQGIFLTHAHFGHIGGLPQFGPEAMGAKRLKILATPDLCALIGGTSLWKPLVSNLEFEPIKPGQSVEIRPDLAVTAVPVPHRDEWGIGTCAFHIRGPKRSLLYLPDIDDWDAWPGADEMLADVDLALVDASFYSREELEDREPVAHPLVEDTVRRFSQLPGQLILTHINHTNPILDRGSPQRNWVLDAGAQIAAQGQIFSL